MLHLISVKKSNFKEIRDLLCIKMEKGFPSSYISKQVLGKLGGIVKIIEGIGWDKDIPLPNAFVFDKNGKFTSFICEYVFGDKDNQPSEEDAKAYFQRVISYPRWDDVLEEFRELAFKQ